ncbi:hypothetical protein ACFFQW_49165 [Umezawaea endophytica]|uniref:Uncharacterized protein n=1 Tax=Umezawaea endophytica TaxID=1654476 RepID=A0A9X2VXU7_9PSEU|nr:hypothetical protein [Umezawaea endophytica]MCS7484684.1 hypothetical protein [Umezawaea endophytica]
MARSAHEANDGKPREYALDVLIARKKPGVSIRQIERDAGLPPGSLAHHLKTAKRGAIPRLATMQRFAAAIGADFTEVTKAFAADSFVAPDSSSVLTKDEREVLDLYRQLSEAHKGLVRAQLQAAVDYVAKVSPARTGTKRS